MSVWLKIACDFLWLALSVAVLYFSGAIYSMWNQSTPLEVTGGSCNFLSLMGEPLACIAKGKSA